MVGLDKEEKLDSPWASHVELKKMVIYGERAPR
jgi:hypothetical protein